MSFTSNGIPIDSLLVPYLQRPVAFVIKEKTIKKGKLLLFKRTHFFLQFSIETHKKTKETFDVPCPFNVESYPQEDLIYFDYRIDSLIKDKTLTLPQKAHSVYYNNILEIQALSPF